MSDAAPAVPTEAEILTASEDEDFDFETWAIALDAGKYDGFLLMMAAGLHSRGISLNVRRWRCTFRDRVFTEEDISAESADWAETFARADNRPDWGWGYITALLGDNVRATIHPARSVLYGICRGEFGMKDRDARAALKKMTAVEVMGCFDWYQVESPGKVDRPA